jgi:hypothetical protein
MTVRKEINEYLFYEFGFDVDHEESLVSDEWPYKLSYLGELNLPNESIKVFEFEDSGEELLALSGNRLSYYPRKGMNLEELYFQTIGSEWIGSHQPVGLDTTRIGYEGFPTVRDRRLIIENIAMESCSLAEPPKILEGLYLESTGNYLALIKPIDQEKRIVVGTGLVPIVVENEELPTWRCLSLQRGKKIAAGKID